MEESQNISPVEIQSYLGGVDYPASKNQLEQHAKSQNAPEEVLSMIDRLPDKEYNSPTDVSHEIGEQE